MRLCVRCLTPMAVCATVLLASLAHRTPGAVGAGGGLSSSSLAIAALTNQSMASYLPAAGFVERNTLPSRMFVAVQP